MLKTEKNTEENASAQARNARGAVVPSENDQCMYFVSKGTCDVKIKTQNILDVSTGDQEAVDPIKYVKTLRPGDHFGEIAILYGCKRTASVETKNYSTLAKLTKSSFLEIQNEFENIVNCFKEHVLTYEDSLRIFIEKELCKIDYFE